MRGNLYIVSAPSGSGKTTLLQHLLRSFKELKFSVSFTTRRPRQVEQNGVDYFFTDRETFLKMAGRGEFLEWAEFNSHLYGTGRAFVEQHLNEGKDVILDIDVQGARQVKSKVKDSIAIFVLPPSFAELERRLKARMLEPDEVIRRRLEIAKGEILFYRDYDYIVINDILENSIVLLESIVRSGAAASRRQQRRIEEIIASFGGIA
ncbi:MAG: guanylate kinase [Acidobacteria bacterium]|nr:guanylate kinase [Acidobacteriota bacterium]